MMTKTMISLTLSVMVSVLMMVGCCWWLYWVVGECDGDVG